LTEFKAFDVYQEKQKKFTRFRYAAGSWKRERRIIGRPIPVLLSPTFKETANSFMRKYIAPVAIWKIASYL
jgi:hypothetical protein